MDEPSNAARVTAFLATYAAATPHDRATIVATTRRTPALVAALRKFGTDPIMVVGVLLGRVAKYPLPLEKQVLDAQRLVAEIDALETTLAAVTAAGEPRE